MKNLHYSTFGLSLILLIPFLFMGCVSEPVKIDWPANHPANPDTQEAEFVQPQNPFETNMADMKEVPDEDSMMKHAMPQESSMQHKDHNMKTDTENHSDSESKMKPDHTERHNQHQEHNH
ncbi:MAG: hypothetical protein JRE72_02430 [Deltaproteobacteria bacterium]|jgi:PBP1b-binding outer membrane lipoprotein LpoB|nr:hypothetical protein [Deltaproteobacteria bacterium]MBW2486249.1 hypothetical protein [Deltaproteobacteria bacterium]